jgi:hypothetical protein
MSEETIITLTGEMWDRQDLIDRMVDDEFYYGYMAKNSLSSSAVKELLKSPRAYANSVNYPQEDCDAFMFGRLIHQGILEADKEFDWNIIDAKDKRSKVWKDALKEELPNTILKRDYDKCKDVIKGYNKNTYTKDLLSEYDTEVPSVVFIDDALFRVKADAIHFMRDSIIDLKTTGDISKFNKWTAMSYGYDCQAYIYCMAFGVDYTNYQFLAIDKITKVSGLYNISEDFFESGRRKVHKAIEVYKKYFVDREERVDNYLITGEL